MAQVHKALERKLHLFKRQKGKCHWCKRQMNHRHLDPLSATLDHVIPRADGGMGILENLVVACKECNERRGRESDIARTQKAKEMRLAVPGTPTEGIQTPTSMQEIDGLPHRAVGNNPLADE